MVKFARYWGAGCCVGGVILYFMEPQLRFSANIFLLLGGFLVLYGYVLTKARGLLKKNLQWCFNAAAALIIASLVVGELFIFAGMRSDVPENCQYVIILGAGLSGDGPSISLLGRLEAALDYLEENPEAKVIASGGVGKESIYSEAEVMEWYLINHGIAAERVLKEEQATRTDENFKFGKQAIKDRFGDAPAAIVIATSDYHMFRSRLIADKYYQRVYGIAAVSPPLIRYNYALREYFALIKMGLWETAEALWQRQ